MEDSGFIIVQENQKYKLKKSKEINKLILVLVSLGSLIIFMILMTLYQKENRKV